MAQPFPCNCSTPRCLGYIAGAKEVPAEKLLKEYFVNEHIRTLKQEQQQ